MPRLVRDGVALAYDDVGRGEAPLLFVHGLGCDRRSFAPQVEQFQHHHRTVSVDLRGHGDSDKPPQAYTMDALADDLVWLGDRLQIERPVVVGHSLGGVLALVLAAQHPELVSGIVMVDMPTAALEGPPQTSDPRVQILEALRGPAFLPMARQFVESLFIPTDDPERKAWIAAGMTSAPQHVFVSALEHVWSVDMASAAKACTVPALYIQAARPRPELNRFGDLCPHLVVGRTVGAGHFNMLEVPDQVNSMIERFLVTSGVWPSP